MTESSMGGFLDTLSPIASVSALAKFGASCEELTDSVLVLLERLVMCIA